MSTTTFNPIAESGRAARREGWVDALRIVACAMVVLSHCCDHFTAAFDSNYSFFLTGTAIGSIVRPCVPLFVMMSGVLLLPINNNVSLSGFYKKRVSRVLIALIFWSLLLPVACYFYFNSVGGSSVNPAVDLTAYTRSGLVNRLWSWIFNFNYDTTPLWYLYMLLGLYLAMPIVNAWLATASRKDLRAVLIVWIATLFIPIIKIVAPLCGYAGNYGNLDIWGGCDWNVYGTFYYMSGFMGYILLAYYMVKYPLSWSNRKLAVIGSLMFAAGFVLTFGGYVLLQKYFPGNYSYLEIAWWFTGINVFIMTWPIFEWFRRSSIRPRKVLTYLAGLTFGIYLCHFFFVMVGYDLFNIASLPAVVRIALNLIFTFSCAAILAALLKSWKVTRKFVS
ncbi:MAG: acyltransferase [Muribaculaceae bacterium]|nr:acyltransferase [Muribaculaceae bacterium]